MWNDTEKMKAKATSTPLEAKKQWNAHESFLLPLWEDLL